MSYAKYVSLLACLLCLKAAMAASSLPSVKAHGGWQISLGQAGFRGDLSGQKGRALYDFGWLALYAKWPDLKLHSYLTISSFLTNGRHEGGQFPYQHRAALKVLGFLFIPTVCYLPMEQLHLCAGIGQGTVNVNADGDRRDYGTWNYQLLLKYLWAPKWGVHLGAKYVGEIEQQVRHIDAKFSLFGAMLGVTYLQ